MITQDELARTAERLRDALTAAADVMAAPDAAAVITPVPQRPGRLRRARAWLVPLAAFAALGWSLRRATAASPAGQGGPTD